jgi:tRNA threonylcarbamoyladenosine biosynthesis protein TsaE
VTAPDLICRTAGPEHTRALAGALATLLRAGDAVALSGELGAGKTCFVQGAAAALGITGRVTSPTFTLVRTYDEGRLPVVHCDVYRLDRLHDVLDLGDEVLAPDVVTFVEWGDAIEALLPDGRLDVELVLADATDPDGDRLVRLRASGDWRERLDELAELLSPWTTTTPARPPAGAGPDEGER